ncbi:F0F1 ATP synthase subunit A [Cohnella thermotolerans]|jgi:F-type H+-transporting ATPase subunit a|uniref:F0F1 ATP synthase subunit A n=1 Tax=Cohnella thermotolerans TaxID=329858 RepID=UPI00041C3ACA|nr:F0F1 ATP synthase subunit A [Cohnella thermotolerans]
MEHLSPIVIIGGVKFDLAAIFMIVLTSILAFVLARLSVRNLSVENPGKLQNFMEWVVEFVSNIIGMATDFKRGRVYLTLGLTLIVYIFIGNMLGLPFNIITEAHHGHATFLGMELFMDGKEEAEFAWWKSPTADAAMTMALALTVIVLSHIQGLRHNRKHYLKHYFEPWPFFFPINLIETLAKPLTLGLRLYGNIYAGEVMISVIMGMGFIGIPALLVWQGFSIFVGAIQAFVFTMLTMVYIGQASIHEEDH